MPEVYPYLGNANDRKGNGSAGSSEQMDSKGLGVCETDMCTLPVARDTIEMRKG